MTVATERDIKTIEELRVTIGTAVRDALAKGKVTFVSYRGIPSAKIVPLTEAERAELAAELCEPE